METLRKLQDGVDPVPKASDALRLVKHRAIAEDELVLFRIGPLEKQNTQFSYPMSQGCLVRQDDVTLLNSPICKTEDEEFDERRLQQQVLVLGAEVTETRDALRPLPDHLHGGGEEVIELFDVVSVLFLVRTDLRLFILKLQQRRLDGCINQLLPRNSKRTDVVSVFLPWNNQVSQCQGLSRCAPSPVKRSCSPETLWSSPPGRLWAWKAGDLFVLSGCLFAQLEERRHRC